MRLKNKLLLSLFSSCIIFTLVFPILSLAFDEDSVYVWSNFSSSVSTSITPSQEEQEENSSTNNR